MADVADAGLFERAVEARAVLLRAERLGAAGSDEREAPAFLLTFDVGRILISADALAGRLDTLHIPSPDDVPGGLLAAEEDEPWWRLMGAPLHAFDAPKGPDAVTLQFRADDDDPRRLTIERHGASLHAKLES